MCQGVEGFEKDITCQRILSEGMSKNVDTPVDVGAEYRTQMSKWLYQLIEDCEFHKSAVELAMDGYIADPVHYAVEASIDKLFPKASVKDEDDE